MSDDSNDQDPEELLQQSRSQRRTSTEPTTAPSDDRPALPDAVAAAFADLEAGELNSTFGFRDERLVALLVGLERSGELVDVVTDAQAALDRERDPASASRSQAASLLIRLGLQHLDAAVLEAGREGYKQHLDRKAEEF